MNIQAVTIVGGSRGIGRGVADWFADRDIPTLVAARTPLVGQHRFDSVVVDVSVETDFTPIQRWLESWQRGRLVLLTAGQLGPIGPIESVPIADFMDSLNVNIGGAVRLLSAMLPILGPQDRLVFFLGGGVGGPRLQPRVSSYIASKYALCGLIESVARDPDTRVPLVGLSPGLFPTDLTREILRISPEVAGGALIDEALKASRIPFDVSKVVEVLETICGPSGAELSGRCVSANRDNIDELATQSRSSTDLLRMRRVDGMVVSSGETW